MTINLLVPTPNSTESALHPSWCDPRTCSIESNFGPGMTHRLHSLVPLRETSPLAGPQRGATNDVRVEVSRSDLRRAVDDVLVDTWDVPVDVAPTKIYVAGLDAVDLDAGQAWRVSAALSTAAEIVAGAH